MTELLNAQIVKKMLHCSLSLVYAMADRGQLPCVRWECPSDNGGRAKTIVRFKQQDIMDFIEKHYEK